MGSENHELLLTLKLTCDLFSIRFTATKILTLFIPIKRTKKKIDMMMNFLLKFPFLLESKQQPELGHLNPSSVH